LNLCASISKPFFVNQHDSRIDNGLTRIAIRVMSCLFTKFNLEICFLVHQH
jgi:hypothetical protein